MFKKLYIYNIDNKINIFLAFFLVFNICLFEQNLARAENRQETPKLNEPIGNTNLFDQNVRGYQKNNRTIC